MVLNQEYSIFLLALGILSFVAGPIFINLIPMKGNLYHRIEIIIFIMMIVLVITQVIPESIHLAGWTVIFFLVVGLFSPMMLEHSLKRFAKQTHRSAVLLTAIGIGGHALIDGLALSSPSSDNLISHSLPAAVILHRFPVGATLWMLIRSSYGRQVAFIVLIIISVITIIGFYIKLPIMAETSYMGNFQALISGFLLHVLIHRPNYSHRQ